MKCRSVISSMHLFCLIRDCFAWSHSFRDFQMLRSYPWLEIWGLFQGTMNYLGTFIPHWLLTCRRFSKALSQIPKPQHSQKSVVVKKKNPKKTSMCLIYEYDIIFLVSKTLEEVQINVILFETIKTNQDYSSWKCFVIHVAYYSEQTHGHKWSTLECWEYLLYLPV